MNSRIKITKSSQSNLSKVDFSNIPFGKVFSDHMFSARWKDGVWSDFEIIPFGNLSIHPACLALHYGQAIFEGMKATKSVDGKPLLLRPEMHAQRINASAKRLAMPEFPEDVFVDALHALVGLDADWIPPAEGSALYLRPYMFADGEFIGVRPSDSYRFLIFTGPVGPYYAKPVSLLAEEHYVRAAIGGVGEAKAAGNYAASLLPTELAKAKGYDQILWLDAKEHKWCQEAGTMNLFFVIDNVVITPSTDGAILKGITRNTLLHILRDKGYQVEERPISIHEVVEAYDKGTLEEVFGAGTAAVIANVDKICYQEKVMQLQSVENHKIAHMLKAEVNGIRNMTITDKFGWIVPVKEPVLA